MPVPSRLVEQLDAVLAERRRVERGGDRMGREVARGLDASEELVVHEAVRSLGDDRRRSRTPSVCAIWRGDGAAATRTTTTRARFVTLARSRAVRPAALASRSIPARFHASRRDDLQGGRVLVLQGAPDRSARRLVAAPSGAQERGERPAVEQRGQLGLGPVGEDAQLGDGGGRTPQTHHGGRRRRGERRGARTTMDEPSRWSRTPPLCAYRPSPRRSCAAQATDPQQREQWLPL